MTVLELFAGRGLVRIVWIVRIDKIGLARIGRIELQLMCGMLGVTAKWCGRGWVGIGRGCIWKHSPKTQMVPQQQQVASLYPEPASKEESTKSKTRIILVIYIFDLNLNDLKIILIHGFGTRG